MILLGGASRTGKGIISQALMKELELPFLSIDPIKMALSKAVPSYNLNTNASSINVSEQLWPFISTLVINMIETGVDTIIEGEILPKQIIELREKHLINVVSCFVGYSEILILEKIDQVKSNTGFPNDWTANLPDSELYSLIEESIEYSKYLRSECIKFNLKYFEFTNQFEKEKAAVVKYVTQQVRN